MDLVMKSQHLSRKYAPRVKRAAVKEIRKEAIVTRDSAPSDTTCLHLVFLH